MQQLANPSDHYPNLGILRLLLALLVTFSHCYPLAGKAEPISMTLPNLDGGRIGVWGFFFLSGFLVTQSYLKRPSFLLFSASRVLRIWPGLIVAIVFSIGVAAFASPATPDVFWPAARNYAYENLTLLKGVVYQLPGAFSNLPHPTVNGSLWTLPWEIRMYAVVLLLGCTGTLLRRETANLGVIGLAIIAASLPSLDWAKPYLSNITVPWVISAFLLGMAVHLNLPVEVRVRAFSVALTLGLGFVGLTRFANLGWLLVICSILGLVGFTNLIRLPDLKFDISYGVYVYSYPVQQLLIDRWSITHPLVLFVAVLPIVGILASTSWVLVEKPCLAMRKHIAKIT